MIAAADDAERRRPRRARAAVLAAALACLAASCGPEVRYRVILTASTGVSLAGFQITVLPQMSAGNIFHAGMAIGKFHGVIAATTPNGSRTAIAHLLGSSDGTSKPFNRRPSPAMYIAMSMASCTSPSASGKTLPISRVSSSPISCLRARKISETR